MSDDDRDIDIESDDADDSDSRLPGRNAGTIYYSQAEKRAHHNALERKRRDHIKDSFTSLRDSVPALQGEKVASRAQILKKAAEYIHFMRKKNNCHQQDIDDLKRQNSILEQQSNLLERAKATGNFAAETSDLSMNIKSDGSSLTSDSSDNDSPSRTNNKSRHNKRIKLNGYA
ncbi:protein max-like [Ctenocephalides felis]|uniref:protein max-like n=1 Tax=Ctenocephalides felis TaxID=7515 RepID=UPI000E6E4943|nr:protein max-like [Ctenocephalides felis]